MFNQDVDAKLHDSLVKKDILYKFLRRINYLKGSNFLRKKFLPKKFLRFIASKMLYSAEEIFAVEGFLINKFFAIQENEPIFAELTFTIERF